MLRRRAFTLIELLVVIATSPFWLRCCYRQCNRLARLLAERSARTI